ncbi:hypothetical protein [Streptomyces sp. NPDC057545]|uniref:hypothetical protein n=1 Tax=Streptomyces sp. NPDC057545 TaxID=3346164 RepID=UPI0036799C6D
MPPKTGGNTPQVIDFDRPGGQAEQAADGGGLIGVEASDVVIMTRRNDGELQQVLDMAAELGVPRAGVLRARTRWKELARPSYSARTSWETWGAAYAWCRAAKLSEGKVVFWSPSVRAL